AEGEDSKTPTESQPTPSPTQPSAGDQPLLTGLSSEHDSSQDPRVNLKGTGGSGRDQVNLPHDSPLLGGHTSDRAEGSLNLEAFSALCTNLSNKSMVRSVPLLSKKKKLSKKKSVSKQGRKNAKLGPTKDDSAKLDAKLDEDMEYMDTDEAVNEGRTHRAPNRLCLNVEVEDYSLRDLNEPASYKAAMLDSESNKWIDAMNAEIQSMVDNMVWVLVDLPPNCKTVRSKWIFKKKTDMDEDGTEIHMLAERRYPLTTITLKRMLPLRLIVESASDAAYDLLRFIQKQIDESARNDIGEKDL
nr:hypothetical protein [Tanacetum cinerariifolium]